MRTKLTQLLGTAAVVAALVVATSPVASADPGQSGCLPFLGCGSWDAGTGRGCIEHLGCANGNLGDLSGCVDGRGCGTYRP